MREWKKGNAEEFVPHWKQQSILPLYARLVLNGDVCPTPTVHNSDLVEYMVGEPRLSRAIQCICELTLGLRVRSQSGAKHLWRVYLPVVFLTWCLCVSDQNRNILNVDLSAVMPVHTFYWKLILLVVTLAVCDHSLFKRYIRFWVISYTLHH